MAYDERLAARIRELLALRPGIAERKMFGGVGFTVNGNVAVGVRGEELIVRIPAVESDEATAHEHVHLMTMRNRGEIRGWLLVGPAATARDADLARWVERGFQHAASLPPK
jgi:TfoX/Sxy family transcriptional regulator of competence genes